MCVGQQDLLAGGVLTALTAGDTFVHKQAHGTSAAALLGRSGANIVSEGARNSGLCSATCCCVLFSSARTVPCKADRAVPSFAGQRCLYGMPPLPAPLCCGGWWPAAVVAGLLCRPVSQQECAEHVITAALCLCLVHSSAVEVAVSGAVHRSDTTSGVCCLTLPHVAACTCSESGRLHDYLFFLTFWSEAFLVMPA